MIPSKLNSKEDSFQSSQQFNLNGNRKIDSDKSVGVL